MFSRSKTFVLRASLLLLAGAMGLKAQMDPRLQKGKTDFLDLYQAGSRSTVKPEILTLLDFSGSMNQIMFNPSFPNRVDEEDPFGCYSLRIAIKATSGVYNLDPSQGVWRSNSGNVYNSLALKMPGSTSSTTYTFTLVGLVKPNGDLVTTADADAHTNDNQLVGSSSGSKDVRNWIRCASHARVKCTAGTFSRTVDLPMPWSILDDDSTGTPLSVSQVQDPKTSTMVALDTTHRGATANYVYLQPDQNGATITAAYIGTAGIPMYRPSYLAWIYTGKDASSKYYIPDAATQPKPFLNGVPARTRLQGLKEAIIKTWLEYQDKVFWAVRGLMDPAKNNSYDATTNTPASVTIPPGNSTSGGDSNWSFFNSYPLDGAVRLSKLVADSGTPLTRSLVHSYIQYQDTNPWDRAHNLNSADDDQRPQDCLKHFLILFTDGVPNMPDDVTSANEAAQPYQAGAAKGNAQIAKDLITSLDFEQKNWNVPTLAGVAAHGGDSRVGWIRDPKGENTGNSGSPSSYAPFFIRTRKDAKNNTYTFSTPHPIQTMTVGLSLGANFNADGTEKDIATDVGSPKYRLLAAATFGDPLKTVYDISKVHSFEADSSGKAKDGSVYYFDAKDPDSLVNNLRKAINAITLLAQVGVASAPVVPFSGLALSRQIYLGNFQVPTDATPLWPGDLMMFPTLTVGLTTNILTSSGTVVPSLSPDTASDEAQWSAKNMMNDPNFWKTRTVYTRIKGSSTNPEPGLVKFVDTIGSTDFEKFKTYLPAGTDADRSKLVSWMRGADTSTTPYTNRLGLMGDIIGSAPTVLEYGTTGPLATLLGVDSTRSGNRVRVIFVGTNSGYFHAFGEYSWEESVTTPDNQTLLVTKATAQELWSFIPTDFLQYLDQLQNPATPHRFMVDGTPSVYHLDLAAGTDRSGNGKVDNGEKAVVVFGLRKGGRSYYALDVSDPLNPTMAWSLRPDESDFLPDSRLLTANKAATRALVSTMGFSSSLPAMGRMLYIRPGETAERVKSVTFLGGGQSVPEVEAQFPNSLGLPTPLGRSVFALDTLTGDILQNWDLSTQAGIGPITAGVVPFELFLGSGLVQRAYFTDKNGGLWALGSGEKAPAPNSDFRLDYSELNFWTTNGAKGGSPNVRKIYQGDLNDIHSTLPAAFNVGTYPVLRTSDPKIAPSAVGVAFVSGDRNNPVDLFYAAGKAPSKHRLNVVFDRQDAPTTLDATGITSSSMWNMTSQTDPAADVINPSKPGFYLNTKSGYYVNFPDPSTVGTKTYIPKGINEPTVLSGVLFYSYFKPTSGDLCSPGAGLTRSWRICDVLRPVTATTAGSSGETCTPGFVMEWSGVASNFGARGTVAVNQAGGVLKPGEGGDTGSGANDNKKVAIGTASGTYHETFPKARVWRSVHTEQN
ncbi:MAG TPA: hypothetical protein VJ570_11305 [Holophagaceae bacterium]|nr:hypothetical protein [Holophagaceae bacterium]